MALKVGLVGCGRWGMNHLKTLVELRKTGQIAVFMSVISSIKSGRGRIDC